MSRPIITIVYNTSAYVVKFRLPLIAALKNAGFDVIVLSPIDETTIDLAAKGISHKPIEMSQYGMNPIAEYRTQLQISKLLKKIKPIASLHYTIKPNIFGSLAAHAADVPVINNIAGAGRSFSSGNIVLRFLVVRLYKYALQHSSKVFFQNKDDMDLFLSKDVVSIDQVHRIPGSGVDLKLFTPTPLPQGKIKFLFLGRLIREKGIEEFLDAADKISEDKRFDGLASFHIIGEHEESKLYVSGSRLAESCMRKSVVYHGPVAPNEIRDRISQASCIVLPSYYGEGVPRVLLEACASGRPIISTDNVGCRDVVEDGVNGYMIPVKDTYALVHAMQKFLMLDTVAKEKMAMASRKTAVDKFDEKIVIQSYLEHISNISLSR